jgi:predicted outer membrane repeat protein
VTSITESTFAGNSADGRGGAIFTSDASKLTVVSSTLTDNSDDGNGTGGIEVDPESFTTLLDTIVAGNFAIGSPGTPSDISGPIQSTSEYNIIGDGSHTNQVNGTNGNLVGTDAQPINTRLGPLGNYGGPTPTIPLLPGSPAIGAGSMASALNTDGEPLTTDQRGLPLIVNGAIDIGAFASQGFIFTTVPGSTPQSTLIRTAFANPLAVIVKANNPLEPVNGGIVSFVAGSSTDGASGTLSSSSAVITNGQASVTATANSISDTYNVSATASGVPSPGVFVLTNTSQVSIVGVTAGWGSAGSAQLFTAADGLRLLPAGRNTDLPWYGIDKLSITLDGSATLTAADISITGVAVSSYAFTLSGSGSSYTITLLTPINEADRVTLLINAPSVAHYIRELDVVPGDVNDDGVVTSADVVDANVYLVMYDVFADITGTGGVVTTTTLKTIRSFNGTVLPPLT